MKSFKEYKYDYGSPESVRLMKKVTPGQKEAMSPADKAAHDKAIAAFKAKGGKIKKLKPGYAQGYHGKDDPGKDMKGMLDKGDSKAFGTRKKVKSMGESMLGHSDAAKLNGGKSKDSNFNSPESHIDYHHRQSGGHNKSGGDQDRHRYQVAKKLGYKVESYNHMNEKVNVNDAHTDAQNHSNGSMSVKKVQGKPSLIMKSYHSEKDGHAFAKKHGYKASNYVKTHAGSRMHLEGKDPGEYDEEGLMMKDQLDIVMDAADDIYDTVSDNENLPEWCQNKITKAADYIDSVRDYLKSQKTTNEDTLPCNNPGCECDPCTCGPSCTCGNIVKEEINELNTDTLKRYHKKTQDHMTTALRTNDPAMKKKFGNRLTGSGRAYQRLKKRGEYKEGSGPSMGDLQKRANIKQSDKDKLLKIRQMLDKEKKPKKLNEKEKDSRLKAAGVEGYNKPKRTPGHAKSSHIVVAKAGDKVKTIRFGQQGVSGSPPKEGESKSHAARRRSFKARHAKNIAKGKMSAAYWADKEKW